MLWGSKRVSIRLALSLALVANCQPAQANPILSANDETGTIVIVNGQQFDISGGQLSADGTNLFHSFEQLGLNPGQIANFLSQPTIRNILGRVVGGNPSTIDGLIQVSGGHSNLLLLNPAGIVFGPNASLNVPADFTAIAATSVGFGNQWFNATGPNQYNTLSGPPTTFAFASKNPGAVLNAGNLSVNSGQSLTLIGGTVANTGHLSAPGGQITLAAVPGESLVRINQSDMLLSLEVQPLANTNNPPSDWELPTADLPALLTDSRIGQATGATINDKRQVVLTGSGLQLNPTTGTLIVSGGLDASHTAAGQTGGNVTLLGDRIAVDRANINVSGKNGGGTALIGGDYQGQGPLPTAKQIFVSHDSSIQADALQSGNGGRAIVWADERNRFLGHLSARGGNESGDGGFVEVSGKTQLHFAGNVDTSASNGKAGTLLLDPRNITISTTAPVGFTTVTELDTVFSDGSYDFSEHPGQDSHLTPATVQNLLASNALVLQANNDIVIANNITSPATNALTLQAGRNIAINTGVTVDLMGDFNATINDAGATPAERSAGTAQFTMQAGSQLSTNGNNLSVATGNFGGSTVGDISLNDATVNAGAGNITLAANEIDLNGSTQLQGSGNVQLQPGDPTLDITVSGVTTDARLNLTASELATLQDGFAQITIGGSSNSGTITLAGNLSFSDPLVLQAFTPPGTIDTTGFTLTGTDNATLNLTAGNSVTAGAIDMTATTGSGNIVVTADEIDLTGNVQGNGSVRLQPLTAGQNIRVANAGNTPDLDLNLTELNRLLDGFSQITIGSVGGNGTITLANNFTVSDPLRLESANVSGAINTTGFTLSTTDNGTLSFIARTIDVGTINTNGTTVGNGNLFLAGDSIDLTNTVQGNGVVTFRPLSPGTDITLANTVPAPGLNLDLAELNQLQDGFVLIFIGRPDGTGTVNLNPFNFQDPVHIVGGSTLIGANQDTTWNLTGTDAGTLSGFNSALEFTNIENLVGGNGSDRFSFSGATAGISGNIDGVGVTDTLDYSAYIGGDVTVALGTNVPGTATAVGGTISSIEAIVGHGAFNNTLIGEDTGNIWSITGSNTGTVNETVSFSNIQNLTGGNGNDTFQFTGSTAGISGNLDGSGGIDTLDYLLYTGGAFSVTLGTTTFGTATGVGGTIFSIENVVPGSSFSSLPNTQFGSFEELVSSFPADLRSALNSASTVSSLGMAGDRLFSRSVNRSTIANLLEAGDLSQAVAALDCFFSEEYGKYLKRRLGHSLLVCETLPEKLRAIAAASGTRPAVIYTFAQSDRLHLLLIAPEGDPIHYQIPTAHRQTLLQQTKELHDQIADITRRRTTSYLKPAQQLYDWIVAPLTKDLKQLEIDTLIFAMDSGLRRLPLAALHDGQQFLVEQYNLSLVPSLALTNTRYEKLTPNNTQVLAMGMSQNFPDNQRPLPGVPVEIATVAEKLWPGEALLNADFTLKNLQQKRQSKPFRVIHLATHGRFLPGAADNSFLQLWDDKLRLRSIANLDWRNPLIELLVLSACHTAVGNEEVELGFAGLALQTGVKSALASLWYVNDTATLGLITGFYDQLRDSSIKANALRRSQIAMIRGQLRVEAGELVGATSGKITLPSELAAFGDRDFAHPYYWAGFTIVGNPW